MEAGYDVHRSTGVSHTVLGAVGVPREVGGPARRSSSSRACARSSRSREPYKLVGRTFKAADTVVDVAGVKVGRRRGHRHGRALLGGERASRSASVARRSRASGARVLRGGAFKPRTSPYSFQGHGEEALRWMREAADDAAAWP